MKDKDSSGVSQVHSWRMQQVNTGTDEKVAIFGVLLAFRKLCFLLYANPVSEVLSSSCVAEGTGLWRVVTCPWAP